MDYFVGFMLTLIILMGIFPLVSGLLLVLRHRAAKRNGVTTTAQPSWWGYGSLLGGVLFTLVFTVVIVLA